MAVSQNGYSVIEREDCEVYTVKAARVNLYLRKGVCGYVLEHFARQFHHRVEPLENDQCWSYNKRLISGDNEYSNHASGTAIDLNSERHPFRESGTFSGNELITLRSLLDDYDDVVRWGGDYRYTKDEMHFEIDRPIDAVKLVAARLRKNNTVVLTRLVPGKRNIDVYMVKRELKRRGFFTGTLNKYFGASMIDAYADFQRSLGYSGDDADGIPGRSSLEGLGFSVK